MPPTPPPPRDPGKPETGMPAWRFRLEAGIFLAITMGALLYALLQGHRY
jgi:hypothetical protein